MVLRSHKPPSGGREQAGMSGADSIVRATGDGEKRWFYGGGLHTWKATAEETNNAFLCFEDHMTEGKMTPVHTHPEADEVFYVLEGGIVVHIEGEERPIGPAGLSKASPPRRPRWRRCMRARSRTCSEREKRVSNGSARHCCCARNGTSGIVRHPASADACDEFGASARSVHVHATAEPGPRWPECRDQPPFPPYLRELTPRIPKEHQPCHSPASTTSPPHSTASAPARVRATRHRSVTPGKGCTSGCSPPGSGARSSASPAVAAASTTRSPSGPGPGSAPESWEPGSSARPDGTRTRSGRAGGVPTHRSTHRPSSSPITRAHRSRWMAARRSTSSTLRLPRHSKRPARLRTARTYASAEVPPWSATSLLPGSSTTCTSSWSRSCSAGAYASGTDWRASRRTTGSRQSPRPAESRM